MVETLEFISATRKLIGEAERMALIDYLAWNPMAGDLIPGTGGVRKLRWALPGRGKSGGVRVIYYHHGDTMPLFLLTAYAKNERADLSHADRNAMKRLTNALAATYRGRAQ